MRERSRVLRLDPPAPLPPARAAPGAGAEDGNKRPPCLREPGRTEGCPCGIVGRERQRKDCPRPTAPRRRMLPCPLRIRKGAGLSCGVSPALPGAWAEG